MGNFARREWDQELELTADQLRNGVSHPGEFEAAVAKPAPEDEIRGSSRT